MDVCKMYSAFAAWGVTLNSCRAVRPIVRLEAPDSLGVLPLNRGGTELNRTVTCMVLKATADDRLTSRSLTCLGQDKTTIGLRMLSFLHLEQKQLWNQSLNGKSFMPLCWLSSSLNTGFVGLLHFSNVDSELIE
ncbi:hypothetical protein TNCV_2696661 [Trichonephila clavipes]|nr:hypothetical protein TNCV_2696661 [Trichonephila clavipes]